MISHNENPFQLSRAFGKKKSAYIMKINIPFLFIKIPDPIKRKEIPQEENLVITAACLNPRDIS